MAETAENQSQSSQQRLKIIKELEKHYSDSPELFIDFTTRKSIECVPSGSPIIDAVTGLPGYPRSRVTELYGPEASGKTTVAIHAIAATQAASPTARCAFIDFEHAFDPVYAHRLGVDLSPDRLIFIQPEYFEQGDYALDMLISAGIIDLAVVDSTAAMTPKDDLEGNIEEHGRIGLQAALMGKFLARATKKLGRGRKCALLLVNQTRIKIDFRNPRNTKTEAAGGHAARFYSSVRLELSAARMEGKEERQSGELVGTEQLWTHNKIKITAVKNKLAQPFFRGELIIDYGKGINSYASVASLSEAEGVVPVSGNGMVNYRGDTPETSISCRGRDALQDHIRSSPAIYAELTRKVLGKIRERQTADLGLSILGTEQAKEISEDGNRIIVDLGSSPVGNTTAVASDSSRPLVIDLENGRGMPIEDDKW